MQIDEMNGGALEDLCAKNRTREARFASIDCGRERERGRGISSSALPVVPFIKDGLRHYLRAYQDCPDWRQTKNFGMIRESLLVLWLPQLCLR